MSYILKKTQTVFSPWVTVSAKDVKFPQFPDVRVFHSLAVSDYVAAVALTEDGRIPVISQYRPAVEMITWELPSGLREDGESPEDACMRELLEETGLRASKMTKIGSYLADPGRLENLLHVFFTRTSNPDPDFVPEPGMTVSCVRPDELREWIRQGKFALSMHIAAFLLCETEITGRS